MLNRPSLPRVREDLPLSARDENALRDEVEANRLIGWAGLDVEFTPHGYTLSVNPSTSGFGHGIVGGTAIAAATSSAQMTSGTGTLASADSTGAITDTGESVTFWNKATNGSIPAGAAIGYEVDDAGNRVIVWWQCVLLIGLTLGVCCGPALLV